VSTASTYRYGDQTYSSFSTCYQHLVTPYAIVSSLKNSKGKTKNQALEGTTADNMKLAYYRPQRASINQSATIGDIPFELLCECLLLLVDLEED
jgi:hypothetical protein